MSASIKPEQAGNNDFEPAPENVIISRDEYERLTQADRKLDALEAHGVDNWEWYGDAMRELYGEEDL